MNVTRLSARLGKGRGMMFVMAFLVLGTLGGEYKVLLSIIFFLDIGELLVTCQILYRFLTAASLKCSGPCRFVLQGPEFSFLRKII